MRHYEPLTMRPAVIAYPNHVRPSRLFGRPMGLVPALASFATHASTPCSHWRGRRQTAC